MSIEELEEFFKSRELPKELQLHPAIKIIDMSLFLKTSISQVKSEGTSVPAYDRLLLAREALLKGE